MILKLYRPAIAAAVLLVLAVSGIAIAQFEHTLTTGRIVNIALAPLDPRSIMQGDYMALAYAIDRELPEDAAQYKYAWLSVDAEQRAALHSVSNNLPQDPQLVAVLLRRRDGMFSVGPNAFFFAEGTGALYEQAPYGQFRVDAGGKALLVSLLDENLQLLGKNNR
ncbi:GDYXXLXY domain-containing protein [Rheinheimera sp. YQF-2]|uniref:GDYXXLXY domain-containing protein n=1 Tax=Rheinheimera lutimaris TaxID=2740584 RepID=A0A7Y5AMN2_9GAMM|nr:GDYXXLXY domain-containing protein [Rheinheimera lutimaris]NRQ41208.1 GDYXXLXY domain-containing protein [Rheinheimera lutimaris]